MPLVVFHSPSFLSADYRQLTGFRRRKGRGARPLLAGACHSARRPLAGCSILRPHLRVLPVFGSLLSGRQDFCEVFVSTATSQSVSDSVETSMTFLLLHSFTTLPLTEQTKHLAMVLGCEQDPNLCSVLRKALKFISYFTLSCVLEETVDDTFFRHTLREDGSRLPRYVRMRVI